MFSIPYATLDNYKNTLMHKSEPRANHNLINRVIMVYELRAETIGTHTHWLPQNQILKLTQHPTIESHLLFSTICIL